MKRLCACGCGGRVNGRYAIRFIYGHQNRGVILTKEHRKKISKALMGREVSIETRRKQSKVRKGRCFNPAGNPYPKTKDQRRRTSKSLKKTLKDPKQRKRLSDNAKKLWQSASYRSRRNNLRAKRKALSKHPNKCEEFIKDYLDKLKVKYEFQHECVGFVPDFILKHRKVIECNGKYWHSLPEVVERDNRKMKAFRKYGYKVLIIIITDKEIEHSKGKVKKRIKKFVL